MRKQKSRSYFVFFQQALLCNGSSVKGRKEILFKFQTTLDEVIDTSVSPTRAGGTIIWGPRGQFNLPPPQILTQLEVKPVLSKELLSAGSLKSNFSWLQISQKANEFFKRIFAL